MAYTKTIACLANSRKYPPPGRCVAGREVHDGGFGLWVRPISNRPTQEISEEEPRYEDGRDPAVLDIIAIQMTEHLPHRHQQENHLIDDGYYWIKAGRMSWREVQAAVDYPGGALWSNGHSSSHGHNDQVPEAQLASFKRSLYLVRPESLAITVDSETDIYGRSRRRVRARFVLNGVAYRLAVTDPPVERQYLAGPNGEWDLNGAVVCVSLAEPFHGYAYKLVASVITPERAQREP